MRIAALFLALCLLFSGAAPRLLGDAVDLIALKKQEDERRKKAAQSKAKVNDNNVTSVAAGGRKYGFVQMESEEPAAGEGEKEKPAAAKADVTKQPDYWKKQQADLEQRIATLRADIEEAQLQLNQLWSDFYIKTIAAEQESIRAQIAQLTNQIEQKKLFLSQSETQVEELLEKARKAGVPPGWLR
ncbi:MAG TPA: hypothetical protein PK919_04050 [Candidatus Aminicenantes bacterium]|nr:hypothetical protein [Candidatus Aminicenantes bacterium]